MKNATLMVSGIDMMVSCSRSNGESEGAMTPQRFVLYGVVIPWLFLVLLVTALVWSGALVEPDFMPLEPSDFYH